MRSPEPGPLHVKEVIRDHDHDEGMYEGAIFRRYPDCEVETIATILDNLRREGEVYVVNGRYRIT